MAKRRSAALVQDRDSTFETCLRISPVAILYGSGARLYVNEYQASHRLLKELWRLGRKRIEIRGMISTLGALDSSSVRALNCYLQHFYGKKSLSQVRCRAHRLAWYDLQRDCALRWVR